ncbi:crustacean calcium-binding protein 23-like [Palaemon carinicauda]|uniref:crustacean calcium-binding protein 23-like n=1 Tax=Palaemon carinicauda TaxID=392227 RepID=UPI0035B65EEB
MTRENHLMKVSAQEAHEATNTLEKLRCLILTKGYDSVLQFGKLLRRHEREDKHAVTKEELSDIIKEYGVEFSEHEVDELFSTFDKEDVGIINCEEFLIKLRPEMSDERKHVVEEAFNKLDGSEDGVISLEEIKSRYDSSRHPKVLSKEATEQDIIMHFVTNFEGGVHPDGKVTKEEFMDYYSGVSKSIGDDEYFTTVVKNHWIL